MNKPVALAIAGTAAITLNTAVLKIAKPLGFMAESGGLLKLFLMALPPVISNCTFFHSAFFWFVFHFMTGALMVILYELLFDPFCVSPLWKGLVFSLFPWLINGVVVLPLLNQGNFGVDVLPLPGIIYYFFANVVFGISLAFFYDKLKPQTYKPA